jgi:hypothetical protein
VGAFFYVRPEAREQAVALMIENGYEPVAPESAQGQLDAG